MGIRLTFLRNKLQTDDMTRHGAIMVTFGLLAGFINYLYQLVMGIMLTPTQYGTLYSLLSLLVILSIVSSAIHTSVTKFASKFKAQGNLGGVNYLWRFSLKQTFIIGLASFLVLSLLSPLLASFLNITNIWYLIILSVTLILVFVLPVNYGILRGLQRFVPLGTSNTFIAILKLATGALLVYLGLGVYGGLLAFIIAQLFVFIFTLYFLRDLTSAGTKKLDTGGLRAYVGPALLAIAAFTVLTNVDVLLVKHCLSPETTGSYSAIAVLGKIAFIVPGGIVVAMFPKTSELYETNTTHHRVLLTLLLAGGVVIIYWLFPDFIVTFLFKDKYAQVAPHLLPYSVAHLLFAFSFLLMNYFLSLNQTRVAFSLVAAMLLQLTLIILFHTSITQIVTIMVISSALSVLLPLPFLLKIRGNRLQEKPVNIPAGIG